MLFRDAYNTTLTLTNEWLIDTLDKLPTGTQPQISVEELVAAEDVVRADETVRKLAAEVGKQHHSPNLFSCVHSGVGVEADQIRCDGWAIGYDDRFPESLRVQQALVFARLGKDENHYAHPLVKSFGLSAYQFINVASETRTLFQSSTPIH